MEELLNKLIERGRKPRGLEAKRFDGEMYYAEIFEHYSNGTMLFDGIEYSLRQLTSKESGLWQFVCENKLVKTKDRKVRYMYEDLERTQNYFSWYGYEYRIIESALCNEEDLEKFLLDNIKIS